MSAPPHPISALLNCSGNTERGDFPDIPPVTHKSVRCAEPATRFSWSWSGGISEAPQYNQPWVFFRRLVSAVASGRIKRPHHWLPPRRIVTINGVHFGEREIMCILNRHLLVAVIVLAGLLVRAWANTDAAPPTVTVVASGTGKDEDGALRQAYQNAIQQVVGTIVDAETVVKDDQIIKEQILTASNAIVSKSERIGQPKVEDGLVTVTVRATIETRQLTERLEKANVISKSVNGEDLFARAVTELQKETDSTKIIQRVFEGFPGNVLKAEPLGEPRVISQTTAGASVGVTVRFSVDMKKYAQWQAAFIPILSKVAKKVVVDRWNPKDRGLQRLDDKYFQRAVEQQYALTVSNEDIKAGYEMPPNAFSKLAPAPSSGQSVIVVFERQGSSKLSSLYFEGIEVGELASAAFAVPMVEVVLRDKAGGESVGQRHVGLFKCGALQPNFMSSSPFWSRQSLNVFYGRNAFFDKNNGDPADPATWRPKDDELKGVKNVGVILFPYMGYCGFRFPVAVPAFSKEFTFQLSLDQLKQLKSVDAKIWSE